MTSHKKLKTGFTTGTAAAASAKAALFFLLSDKEKKAVTIRFLTGETTLIPIHKTKKISQNKAEAVVIKDAGDDPDVTHKAEIGAVVSIFPLKGGSVDNHSDVYEHYDVHDHSNLNTVLPVKTRRFLPAQDDDNHNPDIIIKGGKGVGMVTKPGLEVACGKPAINPGPCKMILEAVNDVLDSFGQMGKIKVEIEVFVPEGEKLAKKTLNFRLGIEGGISILGTTGIVKPMSHDAYIATIESSLSVARAAGLDTVIMTTGRRSERYSQNL